MKTRILKVTQKMTCMTFLVIAGFPFLEGIRNRSPVDFTFATILVLVSIWLYHGTRFAYKTVGIIALILGIALFLGHLRYAEISIGSEVLMISMITLLLVEGAILFAGGMFRGSGLDIRH